MARGKFITLEGGEGCGKSTQAKRLKEALEASGVETVFTREPGGTPLAEEIRRLIKDQDEDAPCAASELLLFLAARAQLVRKVIRPALERGAWVVSDRFSDSTFAYQGYGRGIDLKLLETANGFACDELKPDLTLLLDVSPEVARVRMRGREAATATEADRIERAGEDFHRRLREGFLELARREKDRIVVIDANGSVEEVWNEVWKSLKRIS